MVCRSFCRPDTTSIVYGMQNRAVQGEILALSCMYDLLSVYITLSYFTVFDSPDPHFVHPSKIVDGDGHRNVGFRLHVQTFIPQTGYSHWMMPANVS